MKPILSFPGPAPRSLPPLACTGTAVLLLLSTGSAPAANRTWNDADSGDAWNLNADWKTGPGSRDKGESGSLEAQGAMEKLAYANFLQSVEQVRPKRYVQHHNRLVLHDAVAEYTFGRRSRAPGLVYPLAPASPHRPADLGLPLVPRESRVALPPAEPAPDILGEDALRAFIAPPSGLEAAFPETVPDVALPDGAGRAGGQEPGSGSVTVPLDLPGTAAPLPLRRDGAAAASLAGETLPPDAPDPAGKSRPSGSPRFSGKSGGILGTFKSANRLQNTGTLSADGGGLPLSVTGGALLTGGGAQTAAVAGWTGAGTDNNWSTAANWGGTTPAAGDALTFSGSTRLSPVNNLSAETAFAGLVFSSGAGAFTLTGNAITLTGDVTSSSSAAQTINLPLLLSATRTFDAAAGNLTAGGVLSGPGGLTKTGSQTLTLSGANTFSGPLTVNTGTLTAGVATTAGISGAFGLHAAVTLADAAGAVLDLNGFNNHIGSLTGGGASGGNITLGTGTLTVGSDNTSPGAFAGIISGTGGLTKLGTGTLTLSGNSTFTGTTTVSSGTLLVSGSLSASSPLSMDGGTFTYARTSAGQTLNGFQITAGAASVGNTSGQTLSLGAITASAGATVNFVPVSGAINATAANTNGIIGGWATINGADWVAGGTGVNLTAYAAYNALTAGENTVATTNYDVSGSLVYNRSDDMNTLKLTATGAGQSFDAGNNRLITLTAGGILTTGSDAYTFAGTGNSAIRRAAGAAGDIIFHQYNTGGLSVPVIIQNGTSSGTVSVVKTGPGSLTLSGNNTYTGSTIINQGTLIAGSATALGNGGALVVDGDTAVLSMGAFSETTGAVTLRNGGSITGSSGVLTGSGYTLEDGAISAVLGGSGAINKTTSGTVTLSGANTGSGPVTLSAGTLRATTSAGALGTGSLTLAGGVLELANDTGLSFNRNTTVSGNAAIVSGRLSGGNGVTHTLGTLSIGARTLHLDRDAMVLAGTAGITFGATSLTAAGAVFHAAAGTSLTLGAVSGDTFGFSAGGAGDITIAGAIATTTGTLTKFGSGTLTLSGTSTYTGDTALHAGAILLTSATGLGGTGGKTLVDPGATLFTDGGLTVDEPLTLRGGTLRTTTAINALTTWTGSVDLTAASTIQTEAANPLTVSGALNNGGFALRLDAAASAPVTASNTLSGAGGLIKSGEGTVLLNGSNTFTGGVTIEQGILQTGGSGALNAAPGEQNGVAFSAGSSGILRLAGSSLTISSLSTVAPSGSPVVENASDSAAVLTVGNSRNLTAAYAGVLQDGSGSGSLSLTKTGSGTLTLSGSNTYTGATTVNAGTLALSGSGTLPSGTSVTVSADGSSGTVAALDFNGASAAIGNLILGGPLASGGAAATKNNTVASGSGTLTLGGNVLFNGDQGNQGTSLISGNLSLGGASRTFTTNGVVTKSLSVSAAVSGSGAGIIKDGPAILSLSGANTYTGPTVINAGTLALDSAGALGGGGILTFGGGTLRYSALNSSDLAGRTVNSSSAVTIDTAGLNPVWSTVLDATNTGGLTKTGSGTLTLAGSNAYTGTTSILGGSLAISAAAHLGAASTTLALNGGTLLSTAGTYALGAGRTLTLTGAGTVQSNAGTLTLDGAITSGGQLLTLAGAGNITLSGIISGSGGLSKTGTGTLGLAGANTFTGAVAVNQGAVRVQNSNGLGADNTGAATVAAGAALEFEGGISVNLPVNLNGGGISSGGALRNISGSNTLAGVLTLGSDARIMSDSGTLTISSVTAGTPAGLTAGGSGAIVIGSLATGNTTTLTKEGSGSLTLSGPGNHLNTAVTAGRLNVNHTDALGTGPGGTLTLAGGVTLDNTSAAGVNVSVDRAIVLGSSLAYAGTRELNLGGGTVTLGSPSGDYTTVTVAGSILELDGLITGASGLIKNGPGTLVLGYSGAHAYSTGNPLAFDTVINAGEIYLSSAGADLTGKIEINTGGTLRVAPGVALPGSSVTLNGGTYAPEEITPGDVVFATDTVLTGASRFYDGNLTVNAGVTVTNPGIIDWLGYNPASPVAGRLTFQDGARLLSSSGFDLGANKGILLDSGTVTMESVSSVLDIQPAVAGSGALRKTGASGLHLTGSNTYSGGTLIEAGSVCILGDNSLGDVSGPLTLAGGRLEGGTAAAASPVTMTLQTGRTLQIVKGTSGGLGAQANTTLSYAGTIGETGPSGSGSLIIGGPALSGTVSLSGNNTYTGSTAIHSGILSVSSLADGGVPGPAGASSSAAANLILHGGTLQYTGGAVTTNRLFSVGLEGGTLESAGTGKLTFAGTAGAMGFNGESGSRSLILTGSGDGEISTMVIGDNGGDTMITKRGSGTWTLGGSNTYTGETAIEAGVLRIASGSAIGTGPLIFPAGSTGTLETTGNVTASRTVSLPGNGRIQTAADTVTSLSGTLSGSGSLTKLGSGTLTLSGANSFTGGTVISGGSLRIAAEGGLGAGDITNNGNLELSGNLGFISNAITGTGTLAKTSGAAGTTTELTGSASNTFSGLTTLTGGTLRMDKSGGALALGGDVLINGADSFCVIKNAEQIINSATVTLANGCLDFGTVGPLGRTETITAFNQSGGFVNIYGNTLRITTMNLSGATDPGTGKYTAINSFGGSGGTLEIVSGGTLTFSGTNSPSISIDSGDTVTNRLLLGGDVISSVTAGTVKVTSAGTAAIPGTIDLGSGIRTFTIADGSAAADMEISASLASGGLIKAGGGTLLLSGSGTFAGDTAVSSGVLSIRNGGALGTSAGGTSVASGATLEMQGGITVGAEALTLSGTGAGGSGALRNAGDGNTFGGALTLGSDATITSASGLLTLSHTGAITGDGFDLTVAGAADTIIHSQVSTGTGSLIKSGAGALTLTAPGTYSGGTAIHEGELSFSDPGALGSGMVNIGVTGVTSGTLNYTGPGGTFPLDITIQGGGADAIRNSGSGHLTLSGTIAKGSYPLLIDGGTFGLTHTGDLIGDTMSLQTLGSVTLSGGTVEASQIIIGNPEASAHLTLTSLTGVDAVAGGNTSSHSTLEVNLTSGEVFSGLLGGATPEARSLGLIKSGPGTLEINGSAANTYTGETLVSGGTLRLNKTGGATAVSGPLTIKSGGTVEIAASGQIAAGSTMVIYPGGTLETGAATGLSTTFSTLTNQGGTFTTGANTFSGTGSSVTWNSGTNTISAGGLLQDAHFLITGGTNTVEGGTTAGTLEVQSGGQGMEFGGTSSPVITLNSDAAQGGRILLGGNLTVLSTLTSGTAQILSGGSAASPGRIDLNSGTRTFTVYDGSAPADLLISASLSNGSLIKDGGGTLQLTGSNTHGTTTISGGTLLVGNGGTAGSLSGSAITNNAALVFNRSDTLIQGSGFGSISGSGSLTQNGSGTLELTAANTYSGNTVVNSGTLLLGAGGVIPDDSSVILNGGTLATGGFSDTAGIFSTTASSIIDMGAASSLLTFANTETPALDGPLKIFNWTGSLWNTGGTDQIRFSPAYSGQSYFSGSDIQFYSDNGITPLGGAAAVINGELVPVPEAGTAAGALVLLASIAWRERRHFLRCPEARRTA